MADTPLTFRHCEPSLFSTPAGERRPNPFSAKYDATLALLRDELRHLDATEAHAQLVLAGPTMVRRDGMLRQDARVLHPGVALTIVTRQLGTLVYVADTFVAEWSHQPPSWQCNLRAIALGLTDLRRLDRYGIATRGQQYAGFRELGAGTAMAGTTQTDQQVADFLATQAGLDHLDPCDGPAVRDAYRIAARRHHPDRGGNPAMMVYVNTARDHLLPEG